MVGNVISNLCFFLNKVYGRLRWLVCPLRSLPGPFLWKLSSLDHSSAKVLRDRNQHSFTSESLIQEELQTLNRFSHCGLQRVHGSQWELQKYLKKEITMPPVAWWLLILIIPFTFCSAVEDNSSSLDTLKYFSSWRDCSPVLVFLDGFYLPQSYTGQYWPFIYCPPDNILSQSPSHVLVSPPQLFYVLGYSSWKSLSELLLFSL